VQAPDSHQSKNGASARKDEQREAKLREEERLREVRLLAQEARRGALEESQQNAEEQKK
jgi:hypothetical protein